MTKSTSKQFKPKKHKSKVYCVGVVFISGIYAPFRFKKPYSCLTYKVMRILNSDHFDGIFSVT